MLPYIKYLKMIFNKENFKNFKLTKKDIFHFIFIIGMLITVAALILPMELIDCICSQLPITNIQFAIIELVYVVLWLIFGLGYFVVAIILFEDKFFKKEEGDEE